VEFCGFKKTTIKSSKLATNFSDVLCFNSAFLKKIDGQEKESEKH
jgi:hypothetical protein